MPRFIEQRIIVATCVGAWGERETMERRALVIKSPPAQTHGVMETTSKLCGNDTYNVAKAAIMIYTT